MSPPSATPLAGRGATALPAARSFSFFFSLSNPSFSLTPLALRNAKKRQALLESKQEVHRLKEEKSRLENQRQSDTAESYEAGLGASAPEPLLQGGLGRGGRAHLLGQQSGLTWDVRLPKARSLRRAHWTRPRRRPT